VWPAADEKRIMPKEPDANLSPAQPVEKPAARRPPETAPERRAGERLHILVVEDDADIRESLKTVLEFDGFRVRAAADVPAALKALEQQLPDVALVDIGLPGMDGHELARRARRRWGSDDLRLIAVTGYGEVKDRQAAREAGFDAYLTKPLKPRELYRLLEEVTPKLAR
jgi:CheY-like chemotaxis protein